MTISLRQTHADNTDDLDFPEPSYDQRRGNTIYRVEHSKGTVCQTLAEIMSIRTN